MIRFLFAFVVIIQSALSEPCVPRDYGHESFVCVCNATYCDTLLTNRPVPLNSVSVYTTSKSKSRFDFSLEQLQKAQGFSTVQPTITVTDEKVFQTIKGFGGAATDAATINIKSLSSKTQDQLIASYFGPLGIEYNIIRVPIASCDYSTREYTYLDTPNDFNLSTFALAKEDINYKIPILKSAFAMSKNNLSLYGSPWTAPAWLKTSDNEIGRGWLQGQAGDKYHKTWAEYFTRFLDEYKKHGIEFWGLTVQNEPSNGLLVKSSWQSTGFTAEMQRDFVKMDLGPALRKHGYGNIKLMILDDQRLFLPAFPEVVLADKEAAQYVSGIGVHWYWDWLIGPDVLDDTHNKFPDTFILGTEACNKDSPQPDLGKWDTGVKYSNSILDNLNNWAVGWVDWNMCLDLQGGPNWANNFDDSPVIANATADEFYKQPMFYHLGHFSKFLVEGSVRIHSTGTDLPSDIKYVAAKTPSGSFVLVVLNTSADDVPITVVANESMFNVTSPADSIQTFTWSKYQ
uniref:glucosylceramidase n=1 Tax=Ciona intestinalis TaxID=7719 RepID=UPI000180D41D|nr:glucosylceramidase [Ciona intestinalis]|eukprot:XP_002129322.1 glucosylceramidase [Ciona intestinalis]